MRKFGFLAILPIVGVIAVPGCGKRVVDNSDPTKAQLTIATFDGGVGDKWLTDAARKFEEMYPDGSEFEAGKTGGVQIHITKVRYTGNYMLDTSMLYDMYFTEGIDYYAMTNRNKFEEITDILMEENPDDGGKRIIDKIDDNLKNYMNRENKYFAVPFYDCIYGLVYDKDLFLKKKLYLKDDGTTFTNNPADFGKGPNNVAGDWDDGLPKTYKQFESLLSNMRTKNVIPFTFCNDTELGKYASRMLLSYWSDDEGLENTTLNYTFNGTASRIISDFDGNGKPITESAEINKTNGYLLKKQAGVYNALKFADEILCSTTDNYLPSADVYTAQDSFVVNKWKDGEYPVGMLIEGTWWQNEAVNSFKRAKKLGADSFNYGLMPIPKSSDDKVGEDAVFLNQNESYGFIKKGTSHMKLAKAFFKYLHTDEQLRQFTLTTGMTRGLSYTMSEEEMADLSSFTKDLINIKQSEKVKLVYPRSGLNYVIDAAKFFDPETWVWGAGQLGSNPVTKFMTTKTTARQYYDAHVNAFTAAQWANIIKNH